MKDDQATTMSLAPLRVREVQLHLNTGEVRVRDTPIDLSPGEFRILLHLMVNTGCVVSLNALTDAPAEGARRMRVDTLRTRVMTLRRKLNDHGMPIIRSVYGSGYVIPSDAREH